MPWYYLDGDKEVGPFDKTEMGEFVKNGIISDNTLVRSDASPQWKTLAELRAKPAVPARQSMTAGALVSSPSGMSVCSECGGRFADDEVIEIQGMKVCASCKPLLIQKLKEGAPLATDVRYGGFWIRFVAKFIDNTLLYIVNAVFMAIFGLFFAFGGSSLNNPQPRDISASLIAFSLVMMALQMIVPIAYTTFFVGKYAATPGKMACGLRIITADGGKVSYLRAFGRFWAEILSSIILAIGYIMAGFDAEKRALHDRICDTRVIKK